jgi:hypothetical protein
MELLGKFEQKMDLIKEISNRNASLLTGTLEEKYVEALSVAISMALIEYDAHMRVIKVGDKEYLEIKKELKEKEERLAQSLKEREEKLTILLKQNKK